MIPLNFKPFPVLSTERLSLRQLTIEDKAPIFGLRSSPAINQYLDRDPCLSMEDAEHFIEKINEHIENNNSIYWVITLSNTQAFVGTICLYNFSLDEDSCEIGYELMVEYQGKGIMKEAVKSVVDYAFHTLEINKIIACTHLNNQPSTKLLENLNFTSSKESFTDNPDYHIFTLLKPASNS